MLGGGRVRDAPGGAYLGGTAGGMKRMKRVEKNEKGLGWSTCIYLFSQGSGGSINLLTVSSISQSQLTLFYFPVQLCQTPQPPQPLNPSSFSQT